VRRADIDTKTWTWSVRHQTTPGPGGLIDKGTKGKRARLVPIIEEMRPLVERLAGGLNTHLGASYGVWSPNGPHAVRKTVGTVGFEPATP
jgi:integrase